MASPLAAVCVRVDGARCAEDVVGALALPTTAEVWGDVPALARLLCAGRRWGTSAAAQRAVCGLAAHVRLAPTAPVCGPLADGAVAALFATVRQHAADLPTLAAAVHALAHVCAELLAVRAAQRPLCGGDEDDGYDGDDDDRDEYYYGEDGDDDDDDDVCTPDEALACLERHWLNGDVLQLVDAVKAYMWSRDAVAHALFADALSALRALTTFLAHALDEDDDGDDDDNEGDGNRNSNNSSSSNSSGSVRGTTLVLPPLREDGVVRGPLGPLPPLYRLCNPDVGFGGAFAVATTPAVSRSSSSGSIGGAARNTGSEAARDVTALTLALMKNFADDTCVQASGLRLLSSLARRHARPAVFGPFLASDGMEQIFRVMRRLPGSVAVQTAACELILDIKRAFAACDLVETGAIPAILAALRTHPIACRAVALRTLQAILQSAKTFTRLERLVTVDDVHLVLTAMDVPGTTAADMELIRNGFTVLSRFSNVSVLCEAIGVYGGFKLVFRALALPRTYPRLHKAGLNALYHFLLTENNIQRFIALKGVPAIITLLREAVAAHQTTSTTATATATTSSNNMTDDGSGRADATTPPARTPQLPGEPVSPPPSVTPSGPSPQQSPTPTRTAAAGAAHAGADADAGEHFDRHCCAILSRVLPHRPELQAEVLGLNGVALLLEAMRVNETNQPLQRYCCMSLLQLSPRTIVLTHAQAAVFMRLLPRNTVGSPLMVLLAELTSTAENRQQLAAAALPNLPHQLLLEALRRGRLQSLRQLVALLETLMHMTRPDLYAERIPGDVAARVVAGCLPLKPQDLDDITDVLKYAVDMLGTFARARLFRYLCATLLQVVTELLEFADLKDFARRCGVVEAVCAYMCTFTVNDTAPLRAATRALMSALAAADPRARRAHARRARRAHRRARTLHHAVRRGAPLQRLCTLPRARRGPARHARARARPVHAHHRPALRRAHRRPLLHRLLRAPARLRVPHVPPRAPVARALLRPLRAGPPREPPPRRAL